MSRVPWLLLAWGCSGFHVEASDGAAPDAAMADAGGDDLAPSGDLAVPLAPDGACAWLANADLASSCTDPGPGTCIDVVSCVTGCTGDATCTANCWSSARNANSRSLAMGYVNCRSTAVAAGGPCYAPCQVATTQGQAECIACLHVCSYGAGCAYSCSCGVCSGQLDACYYDR